MSNSIFSDYERLPDEPLLSVLGVVGRKAWFHEKATKRSRNVAKVTNTIQHATANGRKNLSDMIEEALELVMGDENIFSTEDGEDEQFPTPSSAEQDIMGSRTLTSTSSNEQEDSVHAVPLFSSETTNDAIPVEIIEVDIIKVPENNQIFNRPPKIRFTKSAKTA